VVDDRRPGRLIALEGIDGCGKSTQAGLLADRLGAVLTFEPGGTRLGRSLRRLLLDREEAPVSSRAEALLMAADRAQHVDELLRPTLESGTWVVTDRYSASTFAYQGYGRGLDLADLQLLVDWATGGLVPDLTVLIDVPVAVAAARRGDEDQDTFEAEGVGFQQRVADGYHWLAASGVSPWLVVDGTGSVASVAAGVWSGLEDLGLLEVDHGR
jgi:dTMP kinase